MNDPHMPTGGKQDEREDAAESHVAELLRAVDVRAPRDAASSGSGDGRRPPRLAPTGRRRV